jgi:hypothetical protein
MATQIVQQHLGAPPQQSACKHPFGCAAVFCFQNMMVKTHPPPYPLRFLPLPNMKIKFKDQRFDAIEEI